MSKLRFSVVIPCFNEEAHIGETLRTINEQDFKGDYEVIVVDNNSTDDSAKIARHLGARVVSERMPGVCFARQAGTDAARGEIIVSTDADTMFDPNWLTQIDRQFQEQTDAVAICGSCNFVNAPWWGRAYTKILFGHVRLIYNLTKRTVYITATNTAFYKNAWSGYDTALTQGGDELGLLHSLRRRGRVHFTLDHPVYTSSRRLNKGFLYNVFVTSLYYYVLAYNLNRVFGKTVIGNAPAYRDVSMSKRAKDQLIKLGQKTRASGIIKVIRGSKLVSSAKRSDGYKKEGL